MASLAGSESDYERAFQQWALKRRQQRQEEAAQKAREEAQKVQATLARKCIMQLPLRPVNTNVGSKPAGTGKDVAVLVAPATPIRCGPKSADLASTSINAASLAPVATPSREELLQQWREKKQQEQSRTPKKFVLTPVKGLTGAAKRVPVPVNSTADTRTVENDVDDLDMVRLGENIEAWSVQALEKAQAGDVAGARNVLLEGCVTDPRCRAHGRWWLARAHLEELDGNFAGVIAVFEEAVGQATKEQQAVRRGLQQFMKRRIMESDEYEEVLGLLPSPGPGSPRAAAAAGRASHASPRLTAAAAADDLAAALQNMTVADEKDQEAAVALTEQPVERQPHEEESSSGWSEVRLGLARMPPALLEHMREHAATSPRRPPTATLNAAQVAQPDAAAASSVRGYGVGVEEDSCEPAAADGPVQVKLEPTEAASEEEQDPQMARLLRLLAAYGMHFALEPDRTGAPTPVRRSLRLARKASQQHP